MWGPIDPIGTIRVGKDCAITISSPRIRAYPRTINKGRNGNCFIGRGKEYLWRTQPGPRIMTISEPLSEVAKNLLNPLM